jgi:hypothetical protein
VNENRVSIVYLSGRFARRNFAQRAEIGWRGGAPQRYDRE